MSCFIDACLFSLLDSNYVVVPLLQIVLLQQESTQRLQTSEMTTVVHASTRTRHLLAGTYCEF